MAPSASGVGALRDEVVEARLDLDAVLGAPHDDGALEDVLADDHPVALDALDTRAGRRQTALQLEVRLVFVSHAALEPPALAGELRLVERESLLLHHLHGDGLELLQPRGAAELAPADAEPARNLGLVAGAERLRERPRELPEIDPVLGEEVEGGLRAVVCPLGLDELHGQAAPADELQRRMVRRSLALEI